MVPVALYETLGLQACKHILNECKSSADSKENLLLQY